MAVQTGHLVTSSKYARASCHRAVAQPGSLPRCGPLLASRLGVRAPTGPSALIERRRVGDEAPTDAQSEIEGCDDAGRGGDDGRDGVHEAHGGGQQSLTVALRTSPAQTEVERQ